MFTLACSTKFQVAYNNRALLRKKYYLYCKTPAGSTHTWCYSLLVNIKTNINQSKEKFGVQLMELFVTKKSGAVRPCTMNMPTNTSSLVT
jgi:hypothetical protein